MRYAQIDSTTTTLQRVIGWFDTAELDYPNEDFTSADFVEMTDAQWASRMDNPYYDPSSKTFGSTAPAPTLAEAQAAQIEVIRSAFYAAALGDVTDSNGNVWNGGEASGTKIFLACQLAKQNGVANVTLYDASNTAHSMTVADGMKVAAVIGAQYQTDYQKWQSLRAQVEAATTVSAVHAIVWQ